MDLSTKERGIARSYLWHVVVGLDKIKQLYMAHTLSDHQSGPDCPKSIIPTHVQTGQSQSP